MNSSSHWHGGGPTALALLLLVGGCGPSEPAASGANHAQTAVATPAAPDAPPAQEASGAPAAEVRPASDANRSSSSLAANEDAEARRGPSRQARCRINEEAERACTFTPVFGDGSFDLEMPDRQLRLIVDGDEAAPFELIGQRRIPIIGLLQRDPQDRACWISNDQDAVLKRVCAR